ncbi:hypothetical protein O181_100990 [Austropuccinia psidii MF-1]|uniref:Uncharacterized protein n=1 Tax=Austropuccinia psidii MF-1 TaxID=1389203 RepID=A0A9Q3PHC4_9BASI|nr:hypothetical protein [Austropuccinia psidii MF-1]
MSPNIPLTTPIASSMNVLGLNIDVGKATSQTSSTSSIPNISEPSAKSKQPTLNIPSGSQVHMGHQKLVDGGQQKRPLENIWQLKARQSDLRSQLKIVMNFMHLYLWSIKKNSLDVIIHMPPNQEWVMPAHQKKKIVDYEDENMSLTQSEINDEQRRDNFAAHEKGTQSNSEFTHPQMPLAPSMLDQSKMRKQRSQAPKAHNVAKRTSQKEQQKLLKEELPENVHGMRSAVHAHCLLLLKVRDKDFSSLPAPPSTEEHEIAIQVAGHLGYVPKDVFNEKSTQVQSQGFQIYCKNELHKLGLKQFT